MIGASQLALIKPRWPLEAFRVNEFGKYGARRFHADQGACGKSGYPCTHWGADLSAPEGSIVRVPLTGYVLYHGPADKPPFIGYGPYVALIAHADTETPLTSRIWQWATGPLVDIFDLPEGAVSTRYSLIGHLAPPVEDWEKIVEAIRDVPQLGQGPIVKQYPLVGDIWDASKKKPNPDHWRAMKNQPSTVVMYTDADGAKSNRLVYAGQVLGEVSSKNHVHWEIRTSPIAPYASGNWTLDPIDVMSQGYGLGLPSGVPARGSAPPVRGGGGGFALLLAAMLFGKSKRGRKR